MARLRGLAGLILAVSAACCLAADEIPFIENVWSWAGHRVAAAADLVFYATDHSVLILQREPSDHLRPLGCYFDWSGDIVDMAVHDTWLLLLSSDRLEIVDVSDPSRPSLRRTIRGEFDHAVALDVSARPVAPPEVRIFVVCRPSGLPGRLLVFDRPEGPDLLFTADLQVHPVSVTCGYNPVDGHRYVFIGGDSGVEIQCLRHPTSPWETEQLLWLDTVWMGTTSHFCKALTGQARVAIADSDGWVMWDFSNPQHIYRVPGAAFGHAGEKIAVAECNGVPWYLTKPEGTGSGYELWQGAPGDIRRIYRSAQPAAWCAVLCHDSQARPLVAETHRVMMLDTDGHELWYIALPHWPTHVQAIGSDIVRVYLTARYGLFTFRVDMIAGRIELVDFYPLSTAMACSLAPQGWLYVIAAGAGGAEVFMFRILDLDHPALVSSTPLTEIGCEPVADMAVCAHGELMMAVLGWNNVYLYQLTSPGAAPALLLTQPLQASDAVFEWPWLYLGDRQHKELIRVNCPRALGGTWEAEAVSLGSPERVGAVAAAGDYAFAGADRRIQVIRWGPPGEAATRVQTIPFYREFVCWDMEIRGRYLFALLGTPPQADATATGQTRPMANAETGQGELAIYDLSPLPDQRPVLVANTPRPARIPGNVEDLAVAGIAIVSQPFYFEGIYGGFGLYDTRSWQAIAPPGDINGNGVFDLADLAGFMQWWRRWPDDPHELAWRCDINGDGAVNHEDCGRILQLILQSMSGP